MAPNGYLFMSFEEVGLHETIMKGVVAAGYTTPTPIQAQAIPVAVSGRDIIGCAQTGTGKTAAFVLPMLNRLVAGRNAGKNRLPRALVVAPTRELALQVEESVRTYGKYTSIRSQTIYGGVSIEPQIRNMRRGMDIVVATPGRLLDHMNRGTVDLSAVEVLVLDEADRMFDMGFIKDIRKIVAEIPRDRHTMLFSATMPSAVQELANSILTKPQFISIGERRNPAETVSQQVCSVVKERKMDLLLHVLENEDVENVIVFSRTKHGADRIVKNLGKRGFSATVMHSNRSQSQRQRALAGIKNGQFNILVATDIAARGIDVEGVSHVINFDTPNQAEDYIHRIGRTGRAEATGDAITFVARDEEGYLRDIERHTGKRITRKIYDGFEPRVEDREAQEHATAARGGGHSRRNAGTSGGSQGRRRSNSNRTRSARRR